MNLILGDCEERRIPKKVLNDIKSSNKFDSNELKRSLGLIILRGEQIINITVESPPVSDPRTRMGLEKGHGVSRPIKVPTGTKRNPASKPASAPKTNGRGHGPPGPPNQASSSKSPYSRR